MPETSAPASTAADQAEALHAQATALEFGLITECDPGARRLIMSRAGMLRSQARELTARARAQELYGDAQSARRERDQAFAGLA